MILLNDLFPTCISVFPLAIVVADAIEGRQGRGRGGHGQRYKIIRVNVIILLEKDCKEWERGLIALWD